MYLHGSRLTISGLQTLDGAVGNDLFAKLVHLDLSGSLTGDADTNGMLLTTFGEALSAHCPHLKGLNLSNNNLGIPGATAISKMFEHNSYVEMYIDNVKLGDEGLITLIGALKSINLLAICNNDIHTFGVLCLADAVCSGKLEFKGLSMSHFSCLDLKDNPLGLEGTIALGRMLSSSHCQLCAVDVARCMLTTAGGGLANPDSPNLGSTLFLEVVGQRLCQMPQNSAMKELHLDGNCFTGKGIHILAGFLQLCPGLVWLFTRNCGITSDDLLCLLDKVAKVKSSGSSTCSMINKWSLCNNQIDDGGVSAIMDHLPSLLPYMGCEKYGDIELEDNPVGGEMMKRLKEELRKCQEVSYTACSLLISMVSRD